MLAGKQAWSFRNGSWFYGNNRWYPANGTWITDAPDAPTPVDCQNVPAFAQARPPTTQGVVGNRPSDEGVTESSGGCTRYSPHIGRVIPVPCGS